jgi:hypothetical protein
VIWSFAVPCPANNGCQTLSVVNSVCLSLRVFFPSCRRPCAPCFILKYNTYGIFVGKFHQNCSLWDTGRNARKTEQLKAIVLSLSPSPPTPALLVLDLTVCAPWPAVSFGSLITGHSFFVIAYHRTYFFVITRCCLEALRYKLEGRGFDSRWCHWNCLLT